MDSNFESTVVLKHHFEKKTNDLRTENNKNHVNQI